MIELPPWLNRAMDEIGVAEYPGPADNPRIVEYFTATSYKSTEDETPWCSAFCCWSCEGIVDHPGSARARSWLKGWPRHLDYPALGCIVVLERGGGHQPGPELTAASGHVGFFVGFDERGDVRLCSGNQSNSVNVTAYPASRVLGLRWVA